MDTARLRELLDQLDSVKAEIATLVGGEPAKKAKAVKCSFCENDGHTARNCPHKPKSNGAPPPGDAPPPLT